MARQNEKSKDRQRKRQKSEKITDEEFPWDVLPNQCSVKLRCSQEPLEMFL